MIQDYPIIQDFIVGNHNDVRPYNKGLVAHATATPGATDTREQAYYDSGDRQASAHAFIDWDSMTQLMGWKERAWHAGRTANDGYIGIECCEPATVDPAKFNEVYKRAVWLFAKLMIDEVKQTIVTAPVFDAAGKIVKYGNLMSHEEMARANHETNHVDPVAYFKTYGKTVNGFRADVQNMINDILLTRAVKKLASEHGIDPVRWYDVAKAGAVPYLSDLFIKLAR